MKNVKLKSIMNNAKQRLGYNPKSSHIGDNLNKPNILKFYFLVCLFLSNCSSGEVIFQPKEKQAELRIVIKNVRSEGGNVNFALFDSKESFMKTEKSAVAGFRKALVPESIFIISGKLMPGTYAVVAFHDENGNGKLDTHKSGLPKEGIGSSRETKLQGLPKWENCFFEVTQEKTTIDINLVYP